ARPSIQGCRDNVTPWREEQRSAANANLSQRGLQRFGIVRRAVAPRSEPVNIDQTIVNPYPAAGKLYASRIDGDRPDHRSTVVRRRAGRIPVEQSAAFVARGHTTLRNDNFGAEHVPRV